MDWLFSSWTDVGEAAAKAVLMFVVAWIGLRFSERRVLAQLTIVDVVTSVAIGAVVGRTALAGNQSFVVGVAALVGLLIAHRLSTLLRRPDRLTWATDHPVRVLVSDGQPRADELQACGLTAADVYSQLRQQGVFDLADVRFVLYEASGSLSVVPAGDGSVPPLVQHALDTAEHGPMLR